MGILHAPHCGGLTWKVFFQIQCNREKKTHFNDYGEPLGSARGSVHSAQVFCFFFSLHKSFTSFFSLGNRSIHQPESSECTVSNIQLWRKSRQTFKAPRWDDVIRLKHQRLHKHSYRRPRGTHTHTRTHTTRTHICTSNNGDESTDPGGMAVDGGGWSGWGNGCTVRD